MLSHLIDRWNRLHWLTRLSILGSFAASLWWQTRYTSWFLCPQYGWPISFEYLWDNNRGRSLPLFLVDFAVWLTLAGSVGYVVEHWWRRTKPLRTNRRTAVAMFAVIAALCAIGCVEAYFRVQANNRSELPKYGYLDGMNIWLDIGLFTDPVYRWSLPRLVVIGSIGCAIYTAGAILCRSDWLGFRPCDMVAERIEGRKRDHITDKAPPRSDRDPMILRVIIWLLCAIDTLYLIWLLIPPTVVT